MMVSNAETATGADVAKLADLIHDIRIAMLTTLESDGKNLRSRPMATQSTPFDGTLWFFTRNDSGKIEEVDREEHVNVTYSDPRSQRYISISGLARVTRDEAKAKELWSPMLKAWFPKGLDDPTLALLKIDVTEAEYWESPSSTVVKFVGFLKAITTGKTFAGGEHKRIDVGSDVKG